MIRLKTILKVFLDLIFLGGGRGAEAAAVTEATATAFKWVKRKKSIMPTSNYLYVMKISGVVLCPQTHLLVKFYEIIRTESWGT